MQEYYETKKQGRASFIHNTMPVEEANKISSLDKTDSLYFQGGPLQDEEGKQMIDSQDYIGMNMQSDEIAEGFMVDTPSVYLKSEQVFLNNLRTSKRKGNLSRDQCR